MTQDSQNTAVSRSIVGIKLTPYAQFSLALYVLFPLVAGFVSAMQGSGRTSGWPLGFRLAYYLPLALIVMGSSGICCSILSRPARTLRLPLWLLLIAGTLVSGEFIKLYVEWIVPIFDRLLPSTAVGGRVVEFTVSGNLQAGLPTIITWVGINLIGWLVFGIERFGYPSPKAKKRAPPRERVADSEPDTAVGAPSPQGVPNFLIRAGVGSIDQVAALEAQQHYIKIHLTEGSKTILYRFSDAIREAGDAHGLRVHRSWWVNRSYVARAQETDSRMSLVLETGVDVPVSRTYHLRAVDAFARMRTPG